MTHHRRTSSRALQDAPHSPFLFDCPGLWLYLTCVPATLNCSRLTEVVHTFRDSVLLLTLFPLARIRFPFPANLLPAFTALLPRHLPVRSCIPMDCDPLSSDDPTCFQVSLKTVVFQLPSNDLFPPAQGFQPRQKVCKCLLCPLQQPAQRLTHAGTQGKCSEANPRGRCPRSLGGGHAGCRDTEQEGG